MVRHNVIRGVVAGALMVALVGLASPAFGQAMGSARGSVVDANGKPVPEAEVLFDFVGDAKLSTAVKANTRGEFTRTGLRPGEWRVQAQKGSLIGLVTITVTANNQTRMDPLEIKEPTRPAATAAAGGGAAAAEEAEARRKLLAAIQADFAAADAMVATDPDGAIAKFMAVVEKIPECGVCYVRIGDVYLRKQDDAAAEAAFLKAIEYDPKSPDAYSALAGLYNRQKKFAEAAQMSAKANELQSAEGGASAADVLNLGIIAWNAGQFPEAKTHFERATQIDPKLADAFFRLGMANVNLGQLPDAVKAFEEYLKLAPNGEHAEITRGILKSIKGIDQAA